MPGIVEDCHEAGIKRYFFTLTKVNILLDLKGRTKSASVPQRKNVRNLLIYPKERKILLYLKEKAFRKHSCT